METLRVATLNIWNRMGPWDRRLPAIRAGIAAVRPDVLALQEVLRDASDPVRSSQAAEIAGDAAWHVAFAPAESLGGGIEMGNAVLSRWPIARTLGFALPEAPGVGRRAVVYAEIDAPCGRVPVFSVHLSWQLHLSALRLRQARVVAEIARAMCAGSTFPPVVAGDLNAAPEADEIRLLTGLHAGADAGARFVDAFAAAGDGTRGATFCRRNPFTASAREADRRIDYVLVREPGARGVGEPVAARVGFDEPVGGTFASDHFGVVADLRAAGV